MLVLDTSHRDERDSQRDFHVSYKAWGHLGSPNRSWCMMDAWNTLDHVVLSPC